MSIAYMNQNVKNSGGRPVQMGPPSVSNMNSNMNNSMTNNMNNSMTNSMPPNNLPPQHQQSQQQYSPAQIQKMLDDNNQLIQTLVDCQSKGKLQDIFHYSSQLHKNLEFMFRVTDNTANIQSFLPPPTNFNPTANQNMIPNGIHHPAHLQNNPQQQQSQNSMPPPLNPMNQQQPPLNQANINSMNSMPPTMHGQQTNPQQQNNLANPHLQQQSSMQHPQIPPPAPNQMQQHNPNQFPIINQAPQQTNPHSQQQQQPPQQIPVSQSPSTASSIPTQQQQQQQTNQTSQNPSPSTTPNQQQNNDPQQTNTSHMNSPINSQQQANASQAQFRPPPTNQTSSGYNTMMPPPRQPYNPNIPPPNQSVPQHYQQNYNAQPYSQPPHPYNPQYQGNYNHYRPQANVPPYSNYDANNAPPNNWGEIPNFGKMPQSSMPGPPPNAYPPQSSIPPPGPPPNQTSTGGYKPPNVPPNQGYPGYNHYRQPANVPPYTNYDTNSAAAANWNDPNYGAKMPPQNAYNPQTTMPPGPPQNYGYPPTNYYY